VRVLALLASALLAAGSAAGCGGDDEPAEGSTNTVPDLTVPQTDEDEAPAVPQTQTEAPAPPPTTPPSTGGTTVPETEPPADTPENDTPPPADSPAERFEDFCDENPGACG
jgi:hypothetical protein